MIGVSVVDNLIEEVVEQFRRAIEADGQAWVSAAIPFEVGELSLIHI